MNSSPSNEQIMDAIKRSGYLMEQEVATQLEALGFHVWTNWAFEDVDEGKSREIDVRAIKRVAHNEETGISAFIEIIVECKNYENPLVFLGRRKNDTDSITAPRELTFPVTHYEAVRANGEGRRTTTRKAAFHHLGFDKVHYAFTSDTKAVQFCQISRRNKGWEAKHGGLYDAIFYPMAKALTFRQREISNSFGPGYFWAFIPMVVTSGEVLYVDSTKSEPIPERRDYVNFSREIQSEKIKGTFAIDFVRQDSIEQFIARCLQPLGSKMADLTMNEAEHVLKVEIPWEDR